MNRLRLFFFIIGSVVQVFLFVYIAYLFGNGIKFLSVASIYYLETYFVLLFTKNKRVRIMLVGILALPPFLIYFPVHLLSYIDTRAALPGSIAHFYGIAIGALTFYAKPIYLKISCCAFFIVFTILFYVKGYELWLNKINYGNYTGNVTESINDYLLYDEQGNLLVPDSLRNRLVILDFWTTACGVCFEKFPILQNKINYYSKYKNVLFYSVNYPLKSDVHGLARNMLRERNFNFHNLYLSEQSELKKFKVLFFPTVIILLNGHEILYRGDINGVDIYIKKFLNSKN